MNCSSDTENQILENMHYSSQTFSVNESATILLLGSGSSGKTTIMTQLKTIQGDQAPIYKYMCHERSSFDCTNSSKQICQLLNTV